MGDLLCFVSLICSATDPVEILVSNDHQTHDKLATIKQVLRIPDQKFILTLASAYGDFSNPGWPLKLFSPYYKPETVNIFGKDIPVKGANPTKGYIGLVCYNGSGQYMDDDYHLMQWYHNDIVVAGVENVWPQSRFRPISFYSQVFEYCKTHDYDVITLESGSTSLEDKIELMIKHCKAIIGFEGGVAHLSHMLGIPYFMLDWRLPSLSTINGDLHCELVHQSPYLYLLRTDTELFSWSKERFNQIIHDLEHGGSNNRFITGERQLKIDLSKNIIVTDSKDNQVLDLGQLFNKSAVRAFMDRYKLS